MSKKPIQLPSLKYLNECFELDPEGPTGLKWRERPIEHFSCIRSWECSNTKYSGKPAGTIVKNKKSIGVQICGKIYRVHRIVYCIYNKEDNLEETVFIDHINRNPLDNRPVNLRKSNVSQNRANSGPSIINTSGFRNVSWNNVKKQWCVSFTKDSTLRFLEFYDDIYEAAERAEEISLELYGEFSPFYKSA